MNKRSLIILLCVIFVALCMVFISGTSGKDEGEIPMQVREAFDIPDGEFLHYTGFVGGEKYSDLYMVAKHQDEKLLKVYIQEVLASAEREVPANYENYNTYILIDKTTGGLLKFYLDDSEYYVEQDKGKGMYFIDVDVERDTGMIAVTKKIWDGYESKESKATMKNLDMTFPFWNQLTFPFWGMRLLDWSKPGVVFIWDPILKDPGKAKIDVLGEEKIETPLGSFNTYKMNWRISDPFIGALLKPIVTSVYYYFEKDSSKNRLLQYYDEKSDFVSVLAEYKILK